MLEYHTDETDDERNNIQARQDALSAMDASLVSASPMLYLDRRLLSGILARIRMFDKVLKVQGSIIECGVHRGNGLMTWYQLSSILEPVAINRKIIGFDTFSGFPSVSGEDPEAIPIGGFDDVSLDHLNEWIRLQDGNRPLGHLPKVELVVGDASQTIPE